MCSVRFNKQLLRTRLNKLLYILNKIQVKKYKGRGGSTQTIDSPQIPRKSRRVHGTEVFDFVIIAACVGFYLQHWEFCKVMQTRGTWSWHSSRYFDAPLTKDFIFSKSRSLWNRHLNWCLLKDWSIWHLFLGGTKTFSKHSESWGDIKNRPLHQNL